MPAIQTALVDASGDISVHGRAAFVIVVKFGTGVAGVYRDISADSLWFEIAGITRLELAAGDTIYTRKIVVTNDVVTELPLNGETQFDLRNETPEYPDVPWSGVITAYGYRTAPPGEAGPVGTQPPVSGATIIVETLEGVPTVIIQDPAGTDAGAAVIAEIIATGVAVELAVAEAGVAALASIVTARDAAIVSVNVARDNAVSSVNVARDAGMAAVAAQAATSINAVVAQQVLSLAALVAQQGTSVAAVQAQQATSIAAVQAQEALSIAAVAASATDAAAAAIVLVNDAANIKLAEIAAATGTIYANVAAYYAATPVNGEIFRVVGAVPATIFVDQYLNVSGVGTEVYLNSLTAEAYFSSVVAALQGVVNGALTQDATPAGYKAVLGVGTDALVGMERGVATFASVPVQADSSNPDFADVPLAVKPTWPGCAIVTITGASLAIATGSTPALSTTTPLANFHMGTGGLFIDSNTTRTPLIEGVGTITGETAATGLCEYLGTARVTQDEATKAATVVYAAVSGIGGQRIDQMNAPGDSTFTRWQNQVAKGVSTSVEASKALLPVVAFIGGAEGAQAQATTETEIETLRTNLDTYGRAATGQTDPVHLLMMQTGYRIVTFPNAALALQAVVRRNPYVHDFAAEYMFWPGDLSDNTHWANIEEKWIGAHAGRAIHDIQSGIEPRVVRPRAQEIVVDANNRAFLRFRTPTALRENYDDLLATANMGLGMYDAGPATVEGEIWRGSTLVLDFPGLDLATYPTSSCSYAMTAAGTLFGLSAGASGNLTDSTDEYFTFGGVAYTMMRAMLPWRLPIVRMKA